MSNVILSYTVPFISYRDKEPKLIVDKVGVSNENVVSKKLFELIKDKIDLRVSIGKSIPKEIAVELIKEQYDVCLNYIYSNPIWEEIRDGKGQNILLAYIIENRHYLFAAGSRMSAGLGLHSEIKPYSFILSEHLIEEADHAIFFENSLEVLGCDKYLISKSKPSPITLEWIYLMRALSAKHPLVSATCSGLMESSAKNQDVVKNWHTMLMETGIIKREAIEQFYKHVELDIQLGHGSCWEEVILSSDNITDELLKECLNSITIVADQLYRWFNSLDTSLSGTFVQLLEDLKPLTKGVYSSLDNYFDGYPVFSSEILNTISHGYSSNTKSVSEIIALSYYLSSELSDLELNREIDLISTSKDILIATQIRNIDFPKVSLIEIVKSWMISINGHKLWDLILSEPNTELVYGYIFENYHYLNSSVSHTSSAIYSCTNNEIRESLIKHLAEEEKHSEILGKALESHEENFLSYKILRPLPTTISFTGFLKELALTDWKAYCLAISFLQLSIENNTSKHKEFYATAISKNPDIKQLLDSIQKHDILDGDLDHTNDISILLIQIEKLDINEISLRRASQICSLTWSFLDGIRDFYQNRNSVNSRLGWNSNNQSWH